MIPKSTRLPWRCSLRLSEWGTSKWRSRITSAQCWTAEEASFSLTALGPMGEVCRRVWRWQKKTKRVSSKDCRAMPKPSSLRTRRRRVWRYPLCPFLPTHTHSSARKRTQTTLEQRASERAMSSLDYGHISRVCLSWDLEFALFSQQLCFFTEKAMMRRYPKDTVTI